MEKQCRICLDGEIDATNNPLFRPCLCNGTSKFIHMQCLADWRASDPIAFDHCKTCLYQWQFEEDHWMLGILSHEHFPVVCLLLIVGFASFIIIALKVRGHKKIAQAIVVWLTSFFIWQEVLWELMTREDPNRVIFHFFYVQEWLVIQGITRTFSQITKYIRKESLALAGQLQGQILSYE